MFDNPVAMQLINQLILQHLDLRSVHCNRSTKLKLRTLHKNCMIWVPCTISTLIYHEQAELHNSSLEGYTVISYNYYSPTRYSILPLSIQACLRGTI